MRKRKQPGGYGEVPCRSFRPEVTVCPTCQRQLRRYATLPERTVITLTGPFRLIHRSYWCPNETSATDRRNGIAPRFPKNMERGEGRRRQ
jgi:hypothetical protein